jgi:uncharacterized protein (TIGR02231 family)
MLRVTHVLTGAIVCLVVFAAMPSLGADAPDGPQLVHGKVAQVVLYRGQAQIVRSIILDDGQGALELIVTDLPVAVVRDSLFAEGSAGVEVRAVRYRKRAVGEEPREEVRKLDQQIEEVNDQIALNTKLQKMMADRVSYLDKLEGFVAPTAKSELAKGVLNVQTLEQITEFSFSQREAVVKNVVQLNKEQRQFKHELSLLQRRRGEITRGSSRTVHEAVLFLEKKGAGQQTVRLSYLVNNCGWSPAYSFRARSDNGVVQVEYNAVIQQMSGEDWDDVTLTLSTASPALSASGPGLAPFHVELAKASGAQAARGQRVLDRLKSIQDAQDQARITNAIATNQRDNLDTAWRVNVSANDYHMLELTSSTESLGLIRGEVSSRSEGPSLSYLLADTISLASRSDQQMVRIMQSDLEARFYYLASPILTSHVYREAVLVNTTDEDLLGGPVSVHLNGRFVGRTEIPTVARGQTFVVGVGADPQLRATRELVDRKQSIQM